MGGELWTYKVRSGFNRHILRSRRANYCLDLLFCIVETFSVDLIPTDLNSIPEELTLLFVGLQTRVFMGFARDDHVIPGLLQEPDRWTRRNAKK